MVERVYLVAYVDSSEKTKSATLFNLSSSFDKRIGHEAFKFYEEAVFNKIGDSVKYILSIQELGMFSEEEAGKFSY